MFKINKSDDSCWTFTKPLYWYTGHPYTNITTGVQSSFSRSNSTWKTAPWLSPSKRHLLLNIVPLLFITLWVATEAAKRWRLHERNSQSRESRAVCLPDSNEPRACVGGCLLCKCTPRTFKNTTTKRRAIERKRESCVSDDALDGRHLY